LEQIVPTPFEFKHCTNLLKSIGQKASNIHELREIISTVSSESIFHHSYQYFLKGHVLEYTNDFAHWAGESLEERALAERLANIDPYVFSEMDSVRAEFLRVIDDYIEQFPEPRAAMPGEEFFFNETIALVFPVGVRARNLAEFLIAIKYVDAGAIYYHFYEARTRLGGESDDFSKWFEESLDKAALASRVRAIDPFMHNIEGIRTHLAAMVEDELRHDMEEVEVMAGDEGDAR